MSGIKEISVLIVEPDIELQNVYRQNLIHSPMIRLVGVCSSLASATAMLSQVNCDVVFTELNLLDRSGLQLIKTAINDFKVPYCVVIGTSALANDILKCFEAGALGYIVKNDENAEDLQSFVRTLVLGGSPVSPIAARSLIRASQSENFSFHHSSGTATYPLEKNPLSPRETEILQLLAKGMSFLEIASVLQISNHTVTAHIKKIYRKLQVHSRGEAVYEASLAGILQNP